MRKCPVVRGYRVYLKSAERNGSDKFDRTELPRETGKKTRRQRNRTSISEDAQMYSAMPAVIRERTAFGWFLSSMHCGNEAASLFSRGLNNVGPEYGFGEVHHVCFQELPHSQLRDGTALPG